MEQWLDPLEPGEYPTADGQPMAESQVHVWTMMDTISPLRLHFQHRDDVYVGGNLMMYYVEGDPTKPVSPDVFVAFGPSREPPRELWKTWEEGKFADFVLELTSMRRKTRDDVFKPVLYRRLGVTEYWQYDPEGDYLDPPLKGRRLNAEGKYEPIPLSTSPKGIRYGTSKVLGLQLCITDDRLRLLDATTGKFLLTYKEDVQVHALLKEERRLLDEEKRVQDEQLRLLAERRCLVDERLLVEEDNDVALHALETEAKELKRQLARR